MPMLVQEYVNELAQCLVDIDKSPQDVVSAEKIKRLCNEAVCQDYVLTAALTLTPSLQPHCISLAAQACHQQNQHHLGLPSLLSSVVCLA